jgi:hypothetical protein
MSAIQIEINNNNIYMQFFILGISSRTLIVVLTETLTEKVIRVIRIVFTINDPY